MSDHAPRGAGAPELKQTLAASPWKRLEPPQEANSSRQETPAIKEQRVFGRVYSAKADESRQAGRKSEQDEVKIAPPGADRTELQRKSACTADNDAATPVRVFGLGRRKPKRLSPGTRRDPRDKEQTTGNDALADTETLSGVDVTAVGVERHRSSRSTECAQPPRVASDRPLRAPSSRAEPSLDERSSRPTRAASKRIQAAALTGVAAGALNEYDRGTKTPAGKMMAKASGPEQHQLQGAPVQGLDQAASLRSPASPPSSMGVRGCAVDTIFAYTGGG
jgi:hypothetical protein